MKQNFNLLFIFFFYSLSAFTALFWGIYLFAHRKHSLQNLFLGIIFFVAGLLYMSNSFMKLPVVEPCDIYNPLSYFVLIFIAPFAIYYVNYALGKRHSLRHNLAHFIPFASMGLAGILLRISNVPHIPFCNTFRELLGYIGEYPVYVAFFLLLMLIFVAQVITYCAVTLIKVLRIGRQYKALGISRRPLNILMMMTGLFFAYTIVCVVFMPHKNTVYHKGAGFHFFVAMVITAISLLNLKLKLPLKSYCNTPAAACEKPEKPEKPDKSGKADSSMVDTCRSLASKIVIAFEQKEMYKLPNLRLQNLATELGSNRTYVSDCINNHFGCNFNQLLIRYRINAAKELLMNTDIPIQKIIEEVGFNTRSSFYKAFKETVSEEMSPADWRKKNHGRLH